MSLNIPKPHFPSIPHCRNESPRRINDQTFQLSLLLQGSIRGTYRWFESTVPHAGYSWRVNLGVYLTNVV